MVDVTLHCIYMELKVFTSPGGNVAEWNEQQARIQYNWLLLTMVEGVGGHSTKPWFSFM